MRSTRFGRTRRVVVHGGEGVDLIPGSDGKSFDWIQHISDDYPRQFRVEPVMYYYSSAAAVAIYTAANATLC